VGGGRISHAPKHPGDVGCQGLLRKMEEAASRRHVDHMWQQEGTLKDYKRLSGIL